MASLQQQKENNANNFDGINLQKMSSEISITGTSQVGGNPEIPTSFSQVNKTAELKEQLAMLNQKLDKTDRKLKCRDCGACTCINIILLALAAIAFFMVSGDMFAEAENGVGDNQFDKLADMINAQNDDDLDEVENNLMKKFKDLGNEVFNMKSGIMSNDMEIINNNQTHRNNTNSLLEINKKAGQKVYRLEKMIQKMQEEFQQIQNDENDGDYSDLKSNNFKKLLEIFDSDPETFNSKAMQATYKMVEPFDIIEHIFDKNIEYDQSKSIKQLKKTGEYFYEGQVNTKLQKDGIGRSMNIEHALMFEGEYNEDQREGYGRAIYNNGNIYEGEWQDWKQHGKGKMTYVIGYFRGKTFSGQFKENKCARECVWGKSDI